MKRLLRWLLWRQELAYRKRLRKACVVLYGPHFTCRRTDPIDVHAPMLTRRQAE